MKLLKNLAVLGAALQLSACASILSGTEQTLHITSTPAGADCDLSRVVDSDGAPIQFARVAPTPGVVTVDRTKHDIIVRCALPGYETGSAVLESGTEGYAMGNTIAGGVIGWGVDSAFGADNKYPSQVNVPLLAAPATVSTAPVETAPVASPILPLRPLVDAPAAKTPEPISAPAAARLAPAATSPTAPAPVVHTKYPHVAPEAAPQEVPVTGYIAPVPWYKGPAPKPQAAPAATPVSSTPAASQNAAANSTVAIPVKPQEVSDNAPFKTAK